MDSKTSAGRQATSSVRQCRHSRRCGRRQRSSEALLLLLAAVQGLVIFAGVRRMADSRGGHGSRGVGDDDVVVADFSLEEMELDASRRFKTRRFVVPGDHWDLLSNSSQVCLCTQATVDHLHWLAETARSWDGPVSVAVFVPGTEMAVAMWAVGLLRRCHAGIRRGVSFHFTFPVEHPGATTRDSIRYLPNGDALSCDDDLKAVIKNLVKSRPPWRESYPMPQNLLRNVARSSCQTRFTLLVDADMIPKAGLHRDLEDFLRADQLAVSCPLCAFVVPVYEISEKLGEESGKPLPLPGDKATLLRLVGEGKARQFHTAVYKTNQKSSDLERWQKIPPRSDMAVAYKVEKYIFRYEPIYVSRGEAPPFDERFLGYGLTRSSQAYEMSVAGYSFHVLSDAFASHWGFQTLAQRPDWRARQQTDNNARFDEFAREVTARYGRDPYGMMERLKKMNLKNSKVSYRKKKRMQERR